MAMLFDVEIDVVREEQLSYRNEVTEHAVEDGEAIADHTRRLPRGLSISATIAGPDWESRYERLRELADSREVGTYVGVTVWENVVIEGFDVTHTSQIVNGVRFTATLKQVRVAQVETRAFIVPSAPDPVTAAEVEDPPTERGLQQPEVEEIDEETATSFLVAFLRRFGILGGEDEEEAVT